MNAPPRVTGAALALLASLASCGRDPCARAQAKGDARGTAEACQAAFARGGDPATGLAALRARVALKDRVGAEKLTERLARTPAAAQALLGLAELYAPMSDGPARLADLSARLDRENHPAEAALVARLQGRQAWMGSRYQEALSAFDRFVRLAKRAADPNLERRAMLGMFTMLYELGDVRGAAAMLAEAGRPAPGLDREILTTLAFDRGLLADAEERSATARAAFAEVLAQPGVKPTSEVSWNATLNLLALSLEARDLPAARRARQAMDKIFQDGEFHTRSNSRIARGLYSAQLERLEGHAERALELLGALDRERPPAQWGWKLALERGRALAALGRREEAIGAYRRSAEVVEGLRGDQFDDFKSWVLAQRRAPFVALFELHAREGNPVAALEILERTQGRTFLDAFASREVPGEPASALGRIDWLKRLYPALRASPVLAEALLPFERLREQSRGLHALAYFEGEERLHVLEVDEGAPRFVSSAPLTEVRRLVARWLQSPDDDRASDELGAILAPATAIRPGELLYVAPSSLLARVPFAALRRKGRRLIEDHPLAQVPSLNALLALRRAGAASTGPPVVLGNPTLDLPEAEREGAAVAERLGRPALLYLGAAATTDCLRQAARSSVLHLAVHSGVGATGPWLGLHDRRLLAGELLDWHVAPELVVLASCASAATPDPGLWGSLVAAFLASGSRSVVASLWSTEDRVTRELVERFYDEGGRREPALALAHVQRAWLAERRPVRDWAGFALFGAGNNPR